MRHSERFPFRPKSTASLEAGQFWSVPFGNGRFACGRILELGGDQIPAPTRGFFGGLHDWAGTIPPTAEAIASTGFLKFGIMHVRAITETGGEVLGHRQLQLDLAELPLFVDGQKLTRGATTIRDATQAEIASLPRLGRWGYDFIVQLAEQHLTRRAA